MKAVLKENLSKSCSWFRWMKAILGSQPHEHVLPLMYKGNFGQLWKKKLLAKKDSGSLVSKPDLSSGLASCQFQKLRATRLGP